MPAIHLPTSLVVVSCISLVRSMKLLGVTIDKDLNFNEHVIDIVRRVSNQIQVVQRDKKLINANTKTKLYKQKFGFIKRVDKG